MDQLLTQGLIELFGNKSMGVIGALSDLLGTLLDKDGLIDTLLGGNGVLEDLLGRK